MLHLQNKPLSNPTKKVLKDLQDSVNRQNTFSLKVEKAQQQWSGKTSSAKKQSAFNDIKEQLTNMCVSTGLCNYCEQSEATDIEHIAPKSFYPEKAFTWENYILACKICNSGYKLDKCSVISAEKLIYLDRGSKPPIATIHAFINPRIDDPSNYLLLNTKVFQFETMPGLSTQDEHKALQTLEILKLNERDAVREARKVAYNHYYDSLKLLIDILGAETIEDLKSLLRPNDNRFDFTQPLEHVKTELKNARRLYISSKIAHPSVWYAIKTIESKTEPKWKFLFDKLPEALHW